VKRPEVTPTPVAIRRAKSTPAASASNTGGNPDGAELPVPVEKIQVVVGEPTP
jgi:hypothetical protein